MVIKNLNLHGNNYEMGYQQGKFTMGLLGETDAYELFMDMKIIEDSIKIPDKLLNLALTQATRIGGRRILRTIEKELPSQFNRMKGVADGMGLSLRDFASITYFENLIIDNRFSMKRKSLHPQGCTGGLVRYENEGFLAKNYDLMPELQFHLINRYSHSNSKCGYKSFGLTQSFWAGVHSGMNETGLSISLNMTYTNIFKGNKSPATLIVQEILDTCKSTEEAVELLMNIDVPAGWIFIIMDSYLDGVVVEKTVRSMEVREMIPYGEGGYLSASNSLFGEETILDQIDPDFTYITEELGEHDIIPPSNMRKDTMDVAWKKILDTKQKLTVETGLNILSLHNPQEPMGGDSTICRHNKYYPTIESVVFFPRKRELYIGEGNPCKLTELTRFIV